MDEWEDVATGTTGYAPVDLYISNGAPRPNPSDEWEDVATPPPSAPLSTGELVKGFSRSVLTGPTFNFNDNIEAGIAGLSRSLFSNDKTPGENYADKLAEIRAEQSRFKEGVPYVDNAVEIASSLLLNPLGAAGKAVKMAGTPGIQTISKLLTSVPAQAGLASAGMADGKEDPIKAAVRGALLGSAVSATGSVVGNALEKTGINADRFKLSAFGIGSADINKQLKKMGDDVASLGAANEIPIVKTLTKYERAGLVDAGNDMLTNFKNVHSEQRRLSSDLESVLNMADSVVPPNPNFNTNITDDYIKTLSGKAKEQAEAAADEEFYALRNQIGKGSLQDLQKLKIGLNYKFDQNPYREDVVKKLRSDLRREIEDRVNAAAKAKLIPEKLEGSVRSLNSEWGNLAELGDAFKKKIGTRYGGNAIEDIIRGGSTTGGVGSMNIAAAASGNPLYAAVGALVNAARGPEALSTLGDISREFQKPLTRAGKIIPEIFTGRASAQAIGGTEREKKKPIAVELFGKKMQPKTPEIKAIEAEIDKDPFDAAVYQVESGRNPAAKNPVSSASGGFQLIASTAKKLGVEDPFDLKQNYSGFKKLTAQHEKRFGNDPEKLYMAHYLGATVMQKVIDGERLSAKEQQQVDYLERVALPRFMKIYNTTKNRLV